LLAFFRANPQWVRPKSVYNEMMAILEEGLEDLSISRTNFDWGIPVPGGGGVIYVWFDALLNYITAIGWSEDEERFRTYWPASVQLVGKEIARFHTIIWPARKRRNSSTRTAGSPSTARRSARASATRPIRSN
jgi:methionyl-tRNA synthetase